MQDTTKHYINGQWVASIDGREMAVENPSTEQKIATITLGGVADADAAVAAAKAAFPAWAATDPLDRIAALARLMEVYKGPAEDMAQAISFCFGLVIAYLTSQRSNQNRFEPRRFILGLALGLRGL